MQAVIKICSVLLVVAVAEGIGLDHFMFPEHLHKKFTKQIRKAYDIEGFKVTEVETDSMIFEYDFMQILDEQEALQGYAVVTLANGCKIGGCVNPEDLDPETEHEQFYFSTLYDMNGFIQNVKVLEYTSRYGYEITAKPWLKQFVGKKGGTLEVDKEIDGISGATISVHSIVNEINKQQGLLELPMKETVAVE